MIVCRHILNRQDDPALAPNAAEALLLNGIAMPILFGVLPDPYDEATGRFSILLPSWWATGLPVEGYDGFSWQHGVQLGCDILNLVNDRCPCTIDALQSSITGLPDGIRVQGVNPTFKSSNLEDTRQDRQH